jgi:hypothetical protein
MSKILFLFFLILVSCQRPTTVQGRYYPNEFRPELNLSSFSTLSLVSNTLSSGEETDLTIQSMDINGQPLSVGGGIIGLTYEGTGGLAFSQFTDLNNGLYTAKVLAVKNGTVLVKAILNPSKQKVIISNSVQTIINVGEISLTKSVISFTNSTGVLNQPMPFTLTLKDSLSNVIDDNSLQIHPTLLDGTVEGYFSGVDYIGEGKYQGTFTPTGLGTPTKVNLSIRRLGSVISPNFMVVN